MSGPDRVVAVESLMNTPEGRDEFGPPDDTIEHCTDHDVLYRETGRCLECARENGEDV